MKLEETKNLKLQYVNKIQANTTQINNIHKSDINLSEKITEFLKKYEKNPNFTGKLLFKKWCKYCRGFRHSIAECRKTTRRPEKNHKSTKNQTNHFINT